MEPIRVEREKLYEKVWAEPMSSLAKRYSISDVALAKVCRRLSVPVPPRGYWARIRNGYKVTRPPLPKANPGEQTSTTISPVLLRTRELPQAVQEQKAFEAAPENRISEAHFSRKLHPLVQATKQILTGRLEPSRKVVAIDMRVSKNSRDRAFRLLSALFYACEERGYSVRTDEQNGSLLVVKDEPLRFSLEEPSTKVAIPEAKRKDSWSPTYELEPTGRLVFRVQEWVEGVRKTWSDGARQSLEDQLNDLICGLVDISIIVRQKRLEREHQQAVRAEQERQRFLYAERKRQLDTDVQRYQEATRLREFVEQVRNRFATEGNQALLHCWSEWVSRVADHLDPMGAGMEAFLKPYKLE